MNPTPPFSDDRGDATVDDISALAGAHVKELAPDASGHLMDLGFNLVRAAGKYTQVSERRVLRAHEMRWASFSVLFMASLFPGVEARTVARFTGVTRQATSQVLNTLERAGHIVRQQSDPTDRRLVEVRITEQGQHALQGAMVEHMKSSAEWFSRITVEEQVELNRILKKVITH